MTSINTYAKKAGQIVLLFLDVFNVKNDQSTKESSLSVVQLKGENYQKPHAIMELPSIKGHFQFEKAKVVY